MMSRMSSAIRSARFAALALIAVLGLALSACGQVVQAQQPTPTTIPSPTSDDSAATSVADDTATPTAAATDDASPVPTAGSDDSATPTSVSTATALPTVSAPALPTATTSVQVKFAGRVLAYSAGSITAGKRSAAITSATEIKGTITIGAVVQVEAVVAESGLVAREIRLLTPAPANVQPTAQNDDHGGNTGGNGADDGANHDQNDDHGGNTGGSDDGANHDQNDDHGGNTGGGSDDNANHDQNDDHGGNTGGGSDDNANHDKNDDHGGSGGGRGGKK